MYQNHTTYNLNTVVFWLNLKPLPHVCCIWPTLATGYTTTVVLKYYRCFTYTIVRQHFTFCKSLNNYYHI